MRQVGVLMIRRVHTSVKHMSTISRSAMEGPENKEDQHVKRSKWEKTAIACGLFVGGTAATTVAAPLVLGAVGFGSGGIAAGSLAAKSMSLAWTSGAGMGAVSLAQSAGAAGISGATAAAGGGIATGIYSILDIIRGNGGNCDDGFPRDESLSKSEMSTETGGIAAESLVAKAMTMTKDAGMGAVRLSQSAGAAGINVAAAGAAGISVATSAAGRGIYSLVAKVKGEGDKNKEENSN